MWDDLTPSAESKRVLVIGAGPAGIQATVTASERGHSVILCERSGKLGGKLPIVAAPPGKEEFGNYLRYLTAQLSKSSAEVRLNTEVTPELVAELRPNEVIVASGARATIPPIPGVGGPHVCTADDVLCEDLFGSRIVVLGASGTGCETALFLRQRGHDVTIIARSHKAARSLERFTRNVVLEELKATGVKMIFGLDCTEILADRVVCKDAVGEKAEFPCDGVVLARGYESCNQLAEKLRALGYSVRLIGDAVEPRLILHAVGEAYSAAVSI